MAWQFAIHPMCRTSKSQFIGVACVKLSIGVPILTKLEQFENGTQNHGLIIQATARVLLRLKTTIDLVIH